MGVVAAELPGRQTLLITGFDAILTGFFSSSTLWPNLSVTDRMRERAEYILVQVNAESLRSTPVGEMSAGQQRRIMIGRAMAGTSSSDADGSVQMLLLDEPSNALDPSCSTRLAGDVAPTGAARYSHSSNNPSYC